MISRATRVLFAVLRQDFDSADVDRVAPLAEQLTHDEWRRLAAMAASDGVAPIVAANLSRCADAGIRVSPAVLEHLTAAMLENVALKVQRRRQVVEGLIRLNEAGYDALLLKSIALEALGVYREPWVTAARDADMVLRFRADTPLRPDEKSVRWELYTNGVECDRFDHHDVTMHDVVRIPFEDVWQDARRITLNDAPAFVPSAEDHLLLLCLNACRKRYFRLKGLFDIAETVALEPIDWTHARRRARSFGCEAIVFTALTAASLTVGLPSGVPVNIFARPGRRTALSIATRGMRGLHGRAWQGGPAERRVLHVAGAALQYASFSAAQIRRSIHASLFHRMPPPGNAAVENALPGEPS